MDKPSFSYFFLLFVSMFQAAGAVDDLRIFFCEPVMSYLKQIASRTDVSLQKRLKLQESTRPKPWVNAQFLMFFQTWMVLFPLLNAGAFPGLDVP